MMPKGVGADVLGQTGPAHRHLDRLVDDARVNMMATGDASTWIHGKMPRGKDILPAPFFRGILYAALDNTFFFDLLETICCSPMMGTS